MELFQERVQRLIPETVPEVTHRLRRVALAGSVRWLCAPGCHRVQESVQKDPSESRHTEHRVEVTVHFCHAPFRHFYDCAHRKEEGKEEKKR